MQVCGELAGEALPGADWLYCSFVIGGTGDVRAQKCGGRQPQVWWQLRRGLEGLGA